MMSHSPGYEISAQGHQVQRGGEGRLKRKWENEDPRGAAEDASRRSEDLVCDLRKGQTPLTEESSARVTTVRVTHGGAAKGSSRNVACMQELGPGGVGRTQTYYCEVCGVAMEDLQSYKMHIKIKRHLELAARNDGGIQRGSEPGVDPSLEFACDFCEVKMGNLHRYKIHVGGKRHRRLAELKARYKDVLRNAASVQRLGPGGVDPSHKFPCEVCGVTKETLHDYKCHVVSNGHAAQTRRSTTTSSPSPVEAAAAAEAAAEMHGRRVVGGVKVDGTATTSSSYPAAAVAVAVMATAIAASPSSPSSPPPPSATLASSPAGPPLLASGDVFLDETTHALDNTTADGTETAAVATAVAAAISKTVEEVESPALACQQERGASNGHQGAVNDLSAAVGTAEVVTGTVTQPPPTERTVIPKPPNWSSMTNTHQKNWRRNHRK